LPGAKGDAKAHLQGTACRLTQKHGDATKLRYHPAHLTEQRAGRVSGPAHKNRRLQGNGGTLTLLAALSSTAMQCLHLALDFAFRMTLTSPTFGPVHGSPVFPRIHLIPDELALARAARITPKLLVKHDSRFLILLTLIRSHFLSLFS